MAKPIVSACKAKTAMEVLKDACQEDLERLDEQKGMSIK